MTESSLLQAWRDLPTDAQEALVTANFAANPLFADFYLLNLYFQEEICKFKCGFHFEQFKKKVFWS